MPSTYLPCGTKSKTAHELNNAVFGRQRKFFTYCVKDGVVFANLASGPSVLQKDKTFFFWGTQRPKPYEIIHFHEMQPSG